MNRLSHRTGNQPEGCYTHRCLWLHLLQGGEGKGDRWMDEEKGNGWGKSSGSPLTKRERKQTLNLITLMFFFQFDLQQKKISATDWISPVRSYDENAEQCHYNGSLIPQGECISNETSAPGHALPAMSLSAARFLSLKDAYAMRGTQRYSCMQYACEFEIAGRILLYARECEIQNTFHSTPKIYIRILYSYRLYF